MTNYIDYDLFACMENNDFPFDMEDIARMIAVSEGENDGESWRWVVQLKDGRYVFIEGWCDYTGWDCQSGASVTFSETAKSACWAVLNTFFNYDEAWFKHINILDDLRNQVDNGCKVTWRQKMDAEFGVDSSKE
jgi:hypothetical protein